MKSMEILEVRNLVYLARHIGLPGVYKLGVTRCLRSRLSTMNSNSPYGVEIIFVVYTEYPRTIEDSLLEKWKSNRVNGEWLELNEKEIELLKAEANLLAETVPREWWKRCEAEDAIRAIGYSVGNHGNYKYRNANSPKIIWKKSTAN